MRTFSKYVFMQIPGLLAAALVLGGLSLFAGLPRGMAIGLFCLWLAKDLSLYPLLRRAYEPGVRTGAERLVGLRGVARQQLAPRGYIFLRGELWNAEIEPGSAPIAPGCPVRVLAANRLTLTVALDGESASIPNSPSGSDPPGSTRTGSP